MIEGAGSTSFGNEVYLTNDSTYAISDLTATQWAHSYWFPSLFKTLVVYMLISFMITYEHVLHAPAEWIFWLSVMRGGKVLRPFVVWSSMWLRYNTLVLGILSERKKILAAFPEIVDIDCHPSPLSYSQ
jgi:hypothetical protein